MPKAKDQLWKYGTEIPISTGARIRISEKDLHYFKKFSHYFKKFLNEKVRYRKASYKGIGRPRKDDYVLLKRKDIADYSAAESLKYGFAANYSA